MAMTEYDAYGLAFPVLLPVVLWLVLVLHGWYTRGQSRRLIVALVIMALGTIYAIWILDVQRDCERLTPAMREGGPCDTRDR